MQQIIPYTSEQLTWHLGNNVLPSLTPLTIGKIVTTCNMVNEGNASLNDEVAPGVTVADMLTDLKIDYND